MGHDKSNHLISSTNRLKEEREICSFREILDTKNLMLFGLYLDPYFNKPLK
jgi:hypothetical protein